MGDGSQKEWTLCGDTNIAKAETVEAARLRHASWQEWLLSVHLLGENLVF
jgi:hypothetical protein